jgi:hypothetical protein
MDTSPRTRTHFLAKTQVFLARHLVRQLWSAHHAAPDLQCHTLNPTDTAIRFPWLPSDSLFAEPHGVKLGTARRI